MTSSYSQQQFEQDIRYDEISGTIHDICTSRGFPMGGIGTGGFNVFTDGGLGMFRTNHNWFRTIGRTRFPRGTFLALRCRHGDEVTARILRGSYRGGREFRTIRNIAHTAFTGRLPFFDLTFRDSELPVECSLSGFTPLIPRNTKDSSLPAACFSLSVTNRQSTPVHVSLLASFENILGIGGSGGSALAFPLDGPVRYNSIRKNYAERFEGEGYAGLRFGTGQEYGLRDPRRRVIGEYLFFADTSRSGNSDSSGNSNSSGSSASSNTSPSLSSPAVCSRWNAAKKAPRMIDEFIRSGTLPEQEERRGNCGAFSVPCRLQPGETRSIHLYLIWWTPYHVIEKRQRLRKLTGRHRGTDYGHYYGNFFSSATELAEYCLRERERLERETAMLPQILEDSSLPKWLQRYLLNSADSVLVNTVLTKEGELYTMEGVPWRWLFGALTGTVDQRLASHPFTAAFFPEIDRSELLSFVRLSVGGRVPHGNGHADIALGTHEIPYGNPIKSFNRSEVWTDLPQSLILQIGRHVLSTGDSDLLRQCWSSMVEMTDYLATTMYDEIPEGITTYDYMHYHPSFVYTALLHCATLRMMMELGTILLQLDTSQYGPVEESEQIQARLRRWDCQLHATYSSCITLLWDRRGFFHTCRGRETVFTSALAGDWISRLCGLGPVVEYDKAVSHSRWQSRVLVDVYQFMNSRAGITRPLVYREADPEGNEQPAVNHGFSLYRVNNPWQSAGYQGVEAVFLGRVREGLRLIRRIWDKGWFEGYPWDMDHWGMRGRFYMTHPILWLGWDRDHLSNRGHVYMTHPVIWSVLHALTGVSYHAYNETLTVSPRSIPDSDGFRIPVFLPLFWLLVELNGEKSELHCTVIRHFGLPPLLRRVLYLEPDGRARELPLVQPVRLEQGKSFACPLQGKPEPEI
jgi:uncharacterized protein (DUF608 family)